MKEDTGKERMREVSAAQLGGNEAGANLRCEALLICRRSLNMLTTSRRIIGNIGSAAHVCSLGSIHVG